MKYRGFEPLTRKSPLAVYEGQYRIAGAAFAKLAYSHLNMVEHIGFEPMTSSMPWKRASQLRQCPIEKYSEAPIRRACEPAQITVTCFRVIYQYTARQETKDVLLDRINRLLGAQNTFRCFNQSRHIEVEVINR